jgi:hypothetical protein
MKIHPLNSQAGCLSNILSASNFEFQKLQDEKMRFNLNPDLKRDEIRYSGADFKMQKYFAAAMYSVGVHNFSVSKSSTG